MAAATPLAAQTLKVDSATTVFESVWAGPDTLTGRGRQARDVVNALRPKLARMDSVYAVTFPNDSTASVETMRPNGRAGYTLHKKQGKWVVSDTSTLRIYRQSQLAKHLTLPEVLTRADSLAIRKAARQFMKMKADTSTAFARFGIRGDTVFVPTWADPKHVAMTTVHVVRRDGRWVAVSNEGLVIR